VGQSESPIAAPHRASRRVVGPVNWIGRCRRGMVGVAASRQPESRTSGARGQRCATGSPMSRQEDLIAPGRGPPAVQHQLGRLRMVLKLAGESRGGSRWRPPLAICSTETRAPPNTKTRARCRSERHSSRPRDRSGAVILAAASLQQSSSLGALAGPINWWGATALSVDSRNEALRSQAMCGSRTSGWPRRLFCTAPHRCCPHTRGTVL